MGNQKLEELVQRLKSAVGENLRAVILYGSAATDEFHAGHSDLNVLCVLNQSSAAQLEPLHSPIEWWTRRGQRPPLVFTLDELRRSADVFTIELLDMKLSHRVLYGEDVLADLSVPLRYHALQVERELRTDWLRLRQATLRAPRKPRVHLEIMTSSFSAFVALFRHALIALGEAAPPTKREAIQRIAQFAAADPAAFLDILDVREGKVRARDLQAREVLGQYFSFVEAVTGAFDRELDQRQP